MTLSARVPGGVERNSIHESGHVVAARALGIEVSDVRISETGGLTNLPGLMADPVREVAVRAAGEVAEVLAFGSPHADAASSREDRAFAYQAAFEATRDAGDAIRLEHDSRAFVRELLSDRWVDVEHVALALLERGQLSGAQVADLVAVPGVPFRPGPPANLASVAP
jgi:hypothetical protein